MGRKVRKMGIQLKKEMFKPGFNFEEVTFDDIFNEKAITRYYYTIPKISTTKKYM